MRSPISRFQEWLILPTKHKWPYAMLALFGCLPLIIAYSTGVIKNRPIKADVIEARVSPEVYAHSLESLLLPDESSPELKALLDSFEKQGQATDSQKQDDLGNQDAATDQPQISENTDSPTLSIRDLKERSFTFKGYGYRFNWYIMPLLLPIVLFLFRLLMHYLLDWRWVKHGPGLSTSKNPLRLPLLEMFTSGDRVAVRKKIRDLCRDTRMFWSTLCIVILFHALDMKEPLMANSSFVNPGLLGAWPDEPDWTVMSLITDFEVSQAANLTIIFFAYSCQFFIAFIAILCLMIIFRYNILFLNLIYLRSRDHRLFRRPLIKLDLDDYREHRFGLDPMYKTFNAQLQFVYAAGVVVLVSRMANASPQGWTIIDLVRFWKGKNDSRFPTLHELLPDVGQIILAAGYLILFLLVSMMALIKFLPWHISPEMRHAGVPFLLEFFKPGYKLETGEIVKDGKDLSESGLQELRTKLNAQSFWPLGDRFAKRSLLFVLFVGIYVLLPQSFTDTLEWGRIIDDLPIIVANVLVSFSVAFGIMIILFKLLNRFLDVTNAV